MTNLTVKKNHVISIAYSICHEDGEVAEQSDVPVDYIHGVENPMFKKIEQALQGKSVGDQVEVVLPPKDGFGMPDPNLTFTDDLENVPHEFRYVGAKPSFENEQGESMEMVVSKIEGGTLTVDANHPFAGKTMTFNVTVMAIRPATNIELQSLNPASPGSTTLQ